MLPKTFETISVEVGVWKTKWIFANKNNRCSTSKIQGLSPLSSSFPSSKSNLPPLLPQDSPDAKTTGGLDGQPASPKVDEEEEIPATQPVPLESAPFEDPSLSMDSQVEHPAELDGLPDGDIDLLQVKAL